MTRVPFVHVYRSNGRQECDWIDLGDEVAPKLNEIQSAGCRLTAEVLAFGPVSFCIEERELGDFDSEIVPNGPQVPVKITEMLLRFDPVKFQEWKKEMLEDQKEPIEKENA